MAAFYGLCLTLIVVMRFAPQSTLGRWLHLNLVHEPLARAAGLERHHLIFLVIAGVMLLAVGETIAIYGTFEWAMISAFDLSVYLDGVVVTVTLAAAARLRTMATALRTRVTRVCSWLPRAARRRRTRCVAKRSVARSSANDDDHPAVAPLAA
jgi:hypothetical protein